MSTITDKSQDTTTPQSETHHEAQDENPVSVSGTTKSLALGLLFGIIFGFLLQKGGVAKYHVLIGQLLLEDFTVVKVMLSAVVVGMLGIYSLYRANLVEFHIKPTRLVSNVIGGLLFGCGFALSAYCPGTGAAAVGQGNFDAIAMMAGMVAGSYVFAEASGWISRHLDPIGDKGKLTLMDLLPLGRTAITFGTAALLVVVLIVLELTTTR
ncbi:YeeE/YedE family protein [Stieleria mannarensis]|uniref:YeeE/YedE family protein n=1 Tax=Stieleria mannarensis TaxID=2755585 RepID=UPI0015FEEA64|nr:YeeE/YedE thiosulfate transporter family protein [Rhodopirellula sp. JC639]